MMSRKQMRWLSILSAVGTLAVALGAILLANSSEAGQVGVAAAVKPDAFSGGSEIKIGESVFYNQRINTSGEGLVQVLLVDGSTFTVGPGSDLVIDKFVYDPSKGKGEVVASFSKGVLRFVGGKISKNEGGVTVKSPSGTLAIRGGMFQGTPSLFSFLFGVEMKFTGKNGQISRVYQPGYTLDLSGGVANVRPTTAQDTAFFMKSLSGGGKVVVAAPNGPKVNLGSSFLKTLTTAEITEEGTQTIIIGQLAKQEQGDNPEPPPPTPSDGRNGGYAGGMYGQTGDNEAPSVGSLANGSPSEIAIVYNKENNAFSGAKFVLYADPEQGGGVKIGFEPAGDYENLGVASVGQESPDIGSINVYHETNSSGQLIDPASQVSGYAVLAGGSAEGLCQNCSFLKWGAWETSLSFNNSDNEGQTQVDAIGFWVAGNMTSTAELDDLRSKNATASYAGTAVATVASNLDDEGWQIYVAAGQMNMDWQFAKRKGNLEISHFDAENTIAGGLTFQGQMSTPGNLKNKFGGDLSLTSQDVPSNLSDLQGFAQGSFVKGPKNPAQGVMGNWSVGGQNYGATGIFAGSKGVPQ
jgi:hypothetical protein